MLQHEWHGERRGTDQIVWMSLGYHEVLCTYLIVDFEERALQCEACIILQWRDHLQLVITFISAPGAAIDAGGTHLLSQLLQLSKQVLRHARDQAPLHRHDSLIANTL